MRWAAGICPQYTTQEGPGCYDMGEILLEKAALLSQSTRGSRYLPALQARRPQRAVKAKAQPPMPLTEVPFAPRHRTEHTRADGQWLLTFVLVPRYLNPF